MRKGQQRRDRQRFTYSVYAGFSLVDVVARSAGSAARKAFRVLIQAGKLKNQPSTDAMTRGFKGVAIVCRGAV